jgi:N-acyl-L-homoserine lactone synthetase
MNEPYSRIEKTLWRRRNSERNRTYACVQVINRLRKCSLTCPLKHLAKVTKSRMMRSNRRNSARVSWYNISRDDPEARAVATEEGLQVGKT